MRSLPHCDLFSFLCSFAYIIVIGPFHLTTFNLSPSPKTLKGEGWLSQEGYRPYSEQHRMKMRL